MSEFPLAVFSANVVRSLQGFKQRFNKLASENPHRRHSDNRQEKRINQLFDELEFELVLWQTAYSPPNYEIIDRKRQQTLALQAKEFLRQLPQSETDSSSDHSHTLTIPSTVNQNEPTATPAGPVSATHHLLPLPTGSSSPSRL